MRQALRGDNELQRSAAGENEIERAVLVIGGKQTVEGKQARQQCREPKDRRADAFEKREIGSDSKRRHGDDDEKKQHAHKRSTAHTDANAHVAKEQRSERFHVRCSCRCTGRSRGGRFVWSSDSSCTLYWALSSPSALCVATRIRPPSARCDRINSAKRCCAATSSVLVGSSK